MYLQMSEIDVAASSKRGSSAKDLTKVVEVRFARIAQTISRSHHAHFRRHVPPRIAVNRRTRTATSFDDDTRSRHVLLIIYGSRDILKQYKDHIEYRDFIGPEPPASSERAAHQHCRQRHAEKFLSHVHKMITIT